MSLFDLGAIITELSELLGIKVDVATPDALPEAMRRRILRDAHTSPTRLSSAHDRGDRTNHRLYQWHGPGDLHARRQDAGRSDPEPSGIGEAAQNIRRHHPDFVAANPDVPWGAAYGMRNAVVHGHFKVGLERIWTTIA
jgi:hypothetical protein